MSLRKLRKRKRFCCIIVACIMICLSGCGNVFLPNNIFIVEDPEIYTLPQVLTEDGGYWLIVDEGQKIEVPVNLKRFWSLASPKINTEQEQADLDMGQYLIEYMPTFNFAALEQMVCTMEEGGYKQYESGSGDVEIGIFSGKGKIISISCTYRKDDMLYATAYYDQRCRIQYLAEYHISEAWEAGAEYLTTTYAETTCWNEENHTIDYKVYDAASTYSCGASESSYVTYQRMNRYEKQAEGEGWEKNHALQYYWINCSFMDGGIRLGYGKNGKLLGLQYDFNEGTFYYDFLTENWYQEDDI